MAEDNWFFGITGDLETAGLDPGTRYNTACGGGRRVMVTWVKGEKKASETRRRKRVGEEADKVEVAPSVAVGSLKRFNADLVGSAQGCPKCRRLHR